VDADEPPAALPPMAPVQEVVADYGAAGLSLRRHPMSFLRSTLDQLGAVSAERLAALPAGSRLKAAGLVLLRQRPSTANGITFVTLEDETGMVNLIIRPEVWERYRRAARAAIVLLAHGVLQRDAGVTHLLVTRLEDLSAQFAGLHPAARNFR
jgi:error-prone DNA polymerase